MILYRVIWYRVLACFGVPKATMHSVIYQDFTTELYFEGGHQLFKVKFNGTVLEAS